MHADALDFDVRSLFAHPRVKFIGNLPYNISSQLLLRFTDISEPDIALAVHVTKGDGAAAFSRAAHERLRRAHSAGATPLSRRVPADGPGKVFFRNRRSIRRSSN